MTHKNNGKHETSPSVVRREKRDNLIAAAFAGVGTSEAGKKAAHTPGPWFVRKQERLGKLRDCFVAAPDVCGFAYDAEILGDDEYREEHGGIARKLADCNRIVQCVNACEGLPSDALDGGWTAAGISAYAKRLEAALHDMIDWLDDGNRILSDECAADVKRARAALASAEPPPNLERAVAQREGTR